MAARKAGFLYEGRGRHENSFPCAGTGFHDECALADRQLRLGNRVCLPGLQTLHGHEQTQ